MQMSGQFQVLAALFPGKGLPDTHHIAGCVGPRASLECEKKKRRKLLPLPEIKPRFLGRPALLYPFTFSHLIVALPHVSPWRGV
jgi:hypothetical protein